MGTEAVLVQAPARRLAAVGKLLLVPHGCYQVDSQLRSCEYCLTLLEVRRSDIYFVGGFGTVAWVDVNEYMSVQPDLIAADNAEQTLKVLTHHSPNTAVLFLM